MQSEASSWAQEVAGRLWMLQTSFADDPPAARQEYLIEEIQRSVKDVADSRRAEYLDALAHRFPGPERIDVTPSDSTLALAEPVKKTAEELAEELLVRAAELTKERKAHLSERFQAVGLTVVPSGGLNLPPELRGKLGLTPDQPMDEERLNKLFAALLEMVVILDNLIWNLWKTIAPKSVVRRDSGAGFRRTGGHYGTRDPWAATLHATQMLPETT